ncbi:hypothetical protein [Mangrovimonas futianensis]|uniref:hypothetical protein n=1 Tax=Mangrovimonas futianensis TaxID=2895523 RepID=UPI001E4DF2FD|nr:hypothetical protein [Mangrovimonas futianensis]MCF1420314.1 hypothetical protein [Mangrovimonas futianensis]
MRKWMVIMCLLPVIGFSQSKEERQKILDERKESAIVASGEIYINDHPISELDVEYARIVGTSKFLSAKVTIQIDFGQDRTYFSQHNDTQLTDGNGKKIEFYSMIDALNFMDKHGYEFLQAYAITVGNQNVYHYLLRRKQSDVLDQ